MDNEPRLQLCQLIAQYGRSLSEDPRRCGALLKFSSGAQWHVSQPAPVANFKWVDLQKRFAGADG